MTAQNVAGTPCSPQPECRLGGGGEGSKSVPLRGRLSGLALIVDERQQQLRRWSPAHDDRHVDGELVEVAQQLLTAVQDDLERTPAGVADWGLVERHPDPIERLAIAGAMIAAEIDRRLRCERRELDADRLRAEAGAGAAAQPEPLAPDGEARTNQLPEGTTHITAGMRIEEGPARGLDGVQLSWHYHIAAWPSGITLECGRALTSETLRAAFAQRWDGRSVELLLVRGSGLREQIGGEVYGLAPQVLGVDLQVFHQGQWLWWRKTSEPTVQVLRQPESSRSLEAELAELAIFVWTGQGEWYPDGVPDEDDVEDEPEDDSRVQLWDAVNRYAQACGGDTGDASVGAARMDAVVAVDRAVTARIAAAGNLVGGRKLFRIQDNDRPMHVVAPDWHDAIRVWRRELEECDSSADPLGVELVCDSSELRIEGEEVDRG
ncbi:MAG: hypothetical protein IT379_16745 [Deltaproteobacteria bacterium]|nr:hypothetical protein [Deltaproteobacteria bacterium]